MSDTTADKVLQNNSWPSSSEQTRYFKTTADKICQKKSWPGTVRQNLSRNVRATDYKIHQNNSWQNAYETQLTKHIRTTADQVGPTSVRHVTGNDQDYLGESPECLVRYLLLL